MEFVIVGAGIGGLTAGLCLQQSGHAVTIVEKASELNDGGAGIQCGANAVHVLESLGLMPDIMPLAVRPDRVTFCDYRSGESLYRIPLGESYRAKFGAYYLHLHRADLQKVLHDAFVQQSGLIHFSASFVEFTESTDDVTVYIDGGRILSTECLIGADGIRSQVRQQVLGDLKPEFTGNVAWRGLVESRMLPADFMQTQVANFMGPDKHMVVYYVRNRELVNFVGVVESSDWQDASWTTKAPWEQLQADFDGWHETIQTLVEAVDKEHCYRWALHDHRPFNNWSTARVTLLGDAAHATLPFMASGAALAIEDGRILQRAFAQSKDVNDALQLYQRNRINRTARVQRASAKFGTIYHLQSSMARKLAFAGIKVFGGKQESFLPDYNANTVSLV